MGLNSFKRFFVFTASLFFAAAFAGFFGCDSSGGGGVDPLTLPPTAERVKDSGGNATDFVKISVGKMKLAEDDSYEVTITRAYAICDHQVTQKEFETYCRYRSPVHFEPSDTYGKGDNFPVYYVNWYDAILYCNLRSKAENLTPCYKISGESDPTQWGSVQSAGTPPNVKYWAPGANVNSWNKATCDFDANGYRLPTEAEWEIAARGGLEGNVFAGTATNDNDELKDYAWYSDNSGSKTHEVKQKQANGYGLYDMSGNLWELCWDWYDNSAYTGEATDPLGPDSSSGSEPKRVRRGGSWFNNAPFCRVTYRNSEKPHYGIDTRIGFRVVRSAQ